MNLSILRYIQGCLNVTSSGYESLHKMQLLEIMQIVRCSVRGIT